MNIYELAKIHHYDKRLGKVISQLTNQFMEKFSDQDLTDIRQSAMAHSDLAAKYDVPYKVIEEIRS